MLKQKLFVSSALVAALVALTAWRAPAGARMHPWHAEPVRSRSAAAVLPEGFTLPSSDVDLTVSSIVAADLDADGDLDIVASERVSGSLAILVWENDGAGKLTRRQPAQRKALDSAPASPSFEQHQSGTLASIQPDNQAVESGAADLQATIAERSSARPRAPDVASPAFDALRSRAPPSRS